MATKDGMSVIALEEHYWDQTVTDLYTGRDGTRSPDLLERLYDLGELRLREMDEAGIDFQVLSHGAPSLQRFDAEQGVKIAGPTNDRLHEVIKAHPDRFAGFAALPTADPKAAADELERCVTKLGFVGAMVHGLTGGEFFDHKKYWTIFERAQLLNVPLYMHPAYPHPDVVAAYYQSYLEEYPALATAGWGYTVETATQGIRLVLSGVFDVYPDVNIILGHLGESIPFSLWRIDQALSRKENSGSGSFRDTFREKFYITTSGNFSDAALLCCVMELGVDRILFSVDWPFVENKPGVNWAEKISLCAEDRAKILNGNVTRLLRLNS